MTHLPRRFMLAFAVVIASALPGQTQTRAQPDGAEPAAVELPDPLTREAAHELIARLSDDQVRALLIERLDAVASAETEIAPQPTLAERATITARAMGASWAHAVASLPRLYSTQIRAFRTFGERYGGGGILRMLAIVLLALAVGYGAEKAAVFFTRKRLGRETGQESETLRDAVGFLFRRFCRELLGLLVFYVVIRIVGRALLGPEQLSFAAPFVFYLILLPRVGAAVSRFILCPHRSDLRLVNVDDRWAKYLHRNLIGLIALIGFTMFIVGFNARNGVPMGETRLGFWLNTAIHLYIAVIAWTAREGLRDMMRGTDPDRTRFDEVVAYYYPAFAIAVSAAMWLVVEIIVASGDPATLALLRSGPHYVTMFWLLMAPAIDTLIRGLVRHLVPPMIGEGPVATRAYKETKRGYIRIGRVIAGAFVVLMIAGAWNIDLRHISGDEAVGAALIQFIIISALGYVVYEGVSLWINRKLAREMTSKAVTEDEIAGEGGGSGGGSRLATVLPLILISAQIAIAVVFGLLAIGSLGINITPLMAGAGVIGLAIGFGAQKLVTDIVSGVFFLIDDAFRVGEYVDVGGTTGTVEKISIRSMQLRHHRGPVHTIPYGEISKLTNYSRDWVIMKLKFTVPFDTDPNKVKKIFKKIGAEMMEDPAHKDGFLQPFKSQGVFDFDDVGMIIRGKFMAKPGTQFTIRKEIYNRVKAEFAAAGIEFARREVRVAIPGLEDAEHLSEEQKAAVSGAAAGVVQQQSQRE
ncbi:MAG: mechanosensitive ion channel [Rhodobacteraceae bacterium]|nr:mechanosensitive ion channel [Paracoccaceae bacterium]